MPTCCPDCKMAPKKLQWWKCFCGENFNHFENIGKCPYCAYSHEFTECLERDCKAISLHLDWYPSVQVNIKELILSLDLILR